MTESRPDLSIIIPAYNEGPEFHERLAVLQAFLASRDYGQVEIIVILQGDATSGGREIAALDRRKYRNIRVIDLGERAGKGNAVREGTLRAKGHYRMFMDADLATPLVHLDGIHRLMLERADVAIGVRNLFRIHKTWVRKLITKFGNLLIQAILLPGIKDTQCGFKLFSERAVADIFPQLTVVGWAFDLEILALAKKYGYAIEKFEVPDWKDPKFQGLAGDSALKAALQVFRDLLKIRWSLLTGKYRRHTT